MADEAPRRVAIDLNDIAAVSGAVLVIGGVALIYVPAALIIAGAGLLTVALRSARL